MGEAKMIDTNGAVWNFAAIVLKHPEIMPEKRVGRCKSRVYCSPSEPRAFWLRGLTLACERIRWRVQAQVSYESAGDPW